MPVGLCVHALTHECVNVGVRMLLKHSRVSACVFPGQVRPCDQCQERAQRRRRAGDGLLRNKGCILRDKGTYFDE